MAYVKKYPHKKYGRKPKPKAEESLPDDATMPQCGSGGGEELEPSPLIKEDVEQEPPRYGPSPLADSFARFALARYLRPPPRLVAVTTAQRTVFDLNGDKIQFEANLKQEFVP